MKVTVTFGDRAVVVPCKPGWTVRDLMEQATRRYRRILDQDGRSGVNTHHLEYTDGGILDIDDLLTDLVEDRDKLVALFEVQRGTTDSPRESISNGESSAAPSPEPLNYYSHLQLQEPIKGEIEVNEAVLKSNTPLLVRSSSESALAPPIETTTPPEDRSTETFKTGTNHVLRGGAEQATKMSLATFSALTRTVHLLGDRGPLGIQVVPYCSSLSGRMLGLLITNIEDNSRTKKENIFQEDECIVHIDGISLQDKTFADSQELFRQALSSPSMHLEVLPVANKPRYEKGLIGQLFNGEGKELKAKSPVVTRANIDLQPVAKQESKANPASRWQKAAVKTRELPAMNPVASNPQSAAAQARNAPLERVSPTSLLKMASASSPTRTRRQSPPASKSSNVPELTNKKGSKRIKVDLKKGAEGLGFTVVTRDSANGPGPILVKSILPRGAAVKDGRLQPGDRILEVNNMDMTGRSQEELVAMLRGTRQGESVCVVVARQEDIFLPRELKGEDDSSRVLEDGREQLVYEIPLNETGSAGLGVSLKGNKSRETGEDLGIFIKSIIHGGAAYKDGRLRVNDQLIAVNGEALLGRSNHTAMETLRRSMSSEGNTRGTIQLVVLRACRVEEPEGHRAYEGASRPSALTDKYMTGGSGGALHPSATTNGNQGHHGNKEGFPSSTVEDMTGDPQLKSLQYRKGPADSQVYKHKDDLPRNRASKSMDLVADESNMRSLVGPTNEDTTGGRLGPTLGLWKSSSLESLQSAMSEAQQDHIKARVPFYRPPPQMVRGRGCNQSFRIAIDKSYEGPSEDDDDLSERSSGHETPASSSSRQDLDVEDGRSLKKVGGKKQEKKSKGKKKREEAADDVDKKTKKKGFGLLRFGKKKEDKSKDALRVVKNKLEALSEEEGGGRDSFDPQYSEINYDQLTPDSGTLPDVEDDDTDPNYARINNFLQPDSPQLPGHTHSLAAPVTAAGKQPHLDNLYAQVVKPRQQPAESDPRYQAVRREYQPARAAPAYDELDTARRGALEHDPHRVAPRHVHLYEELDGPHHTHTRRDPYDYLSHSRSAHREPVRYQDSSLPQVASANQRHYPAATRLDVPASPAAGRQGRHYYEAAGGRGDGYRQDSPGRYGYEDERQRDPRVKNPMIGAV